MSEGLLNTMDMRPIYTLIIAAAGWFSSVAIITSANLGTTIQTGIATKPEVVIYMIFGTTMGLILLAFMVLYYIQFGKKQIDDAI